VKTDISEGLARAKKDRPFQLVGGHAALDLVNTLDWRFREEPPEELLLSFGDLIRFVQQCGLVTPLEAKRLVRGTTAHKGGRVVEDVRQMRESAARIFYAAVEGNHPPGEAIREVEDWVKEAEKHQQLRWNGSHLERAFPDGAVTAEFPLWILALKVAEFLTSDAMSMMRSCGSADCQWLFVDASKNHTRRWCDMKLCGNRMKARRFKAQQRG
jgi:predicted RNA-binding Zn ribbon-like protein